MFANDLFYCGTSSGYHKTEDFMCCIAFADKYEDFYDIPSDRNSELSQSGDEYDPDWR